METCGTCRGVGHINFKTCPSCGGAGQLDKEAGKFSPPKLKVGRSDMAKKAKTFLLVAGGAAIVAVGTTMALNSNAARSMGQSISSISDLGTMKAVLTGKPTEADARKVLAEALNGDYIRMFDFKKVDGQTFQFLGVEVYRLDFTASLEIRVTFFDAMTPYAQAVDRREDGATRRFGEADIYFTKMSDLVGRLFGSRDQGWEGRKVGELLFVRGSVLFKKSENGWQGEIMK